MYLKCRTVTIRTITVRMYVLNGRFLNDEICRSAKKREKENENGN